MSDWYIETPREHSNPKFFHAICAFVAEQCWVALDAVDRANQAFENEQATVFEQKREFWAAIQAFLGATANVSKALWGSTPARSAERRSPVREWLEVADDSPLKPRKMRNNLEHFDERLEYWADLYRPLVDATIGPAEDLNGNHPQAIFRHYDPTRGQLIFWGESYDLNVVTVEIIRLYNQLMGVEWTPASRKANGPGDDPPASAQ